MQTGVAIVDTGIYRHRDFGSRITGFVDLVHGKNSAYDDSGHGTHIAGIIGGDGSASRGRYKGIAPHSALIGVKVLDAQGNGKISDVVEGLRWILEQRERYNIRVVNISFGTVPDHDVQEEKQLNRQVEQLWDAGIVEEEPGKFRRIIAAPLPIDIYEIDAVKALLDADQIVIAAGGGGIPVLQQGTHLKGASAIIEKDYTAAKLAELVNAQTLLFLTAYDNLTIEKGTPNEKVFEQVSASDLHTYIKAGHFPAKTTFPKVDASIRFVTADSERKAVISNLDKAKSSLAGKTGTTITA
jgi:predicted CopG family antitoxin